MKCNKCEEREAYMEEKKRRAIERLEGILDSEGKDGFIGSFEGVTIDETFTPKALMGLVAHVSKMRKTPLGIV